jgi:hypothetical protein
LEKLLPELRNCQYAFMEDAPFQLVLESKPSEGMRIYWREMLFRAHLVASTAIIRSLKWLAALMQASADPNALAFAATARGFLESAGDTTTALLAVPESLAKYLSKIELALAGDLEEPLLVAPSLEEDLIHFTHGRKLSKGESGPVSHRAKTVREYLDILERGQVEGIGELYSLLCDITHPGASSVGMWLTELQPGQYRLSLESDAPVIEGILAQFGDALNQAIPFALNPPTLTLAVLNYFSTPEVHTKQLIAWNFEGIRMWQNCQQHLAGLSPRFTP